MSMIARATAVALGLGVASHVWAEGEPIPQPSFDS